MESNNHGSFCKFPGYFFQIYEICVQLLWVTKIFMTWITKLKIFRFKVSLKFYHSKCVFSPLPSSRLLYALRPKYRKYCLEKWALFSANVPSLSPAHLFLLRLLFPLLHSDSLFPLCYPSQSFPQPFCSWSVYRAFAVKGALTSLVMSYSQNFPSLTYISWVTCSVHRDGEASTFDSGVNISVRQYFRTWIQWKYLSRRSYFPYETMIVETLL